jgi:hypothetical protein
VPEEGVGAAKLLTSAIVTSRPTAQIEKNTPRRVLADTDKEELVFIIAWSD